MTSLSTRFFGHPRLMNPTFGMQVCNHSSMALNSTYAGPLGGASQHFWCLIRLLNAGDGFLIESDAPNVAPLILIYDPVW
jgi:hypothetical protein